MDKATERFWERHEWLIEHRADSFYVNMLNAVMRRAMRPTGGNGNHRLAAAREYGAQSVLAVIAPPCAVHI